MAVMSIDDEGILSGCPRYGHPQPIAPVQNNAATAIRRADGTLRMNLDKRASVTFSDVPFEFDKASSQAKRERNSTHASLCKNIEFAKNLWLENTSCNSGMKSSERQPKRFTSSRKGVRNKLRVRGRASYRRVAMFGKEPSNYATGKFCL
jgi:hypothetical protein